MAGCCEGCPVSRLDHVLDMRQQGRPRTQGVDGKLWKVDLRGCIMPKPKAEWMWARTTLSSVG